MAVAAPARSADGNEHRIRVLDRRRQVGGEAEGTGIDVLLHQSIQAGLVDGHLAGFQHVDLGGVLVDANDVDTEF
jgi:hypothetical protein